MAQSMVRLWACLLVLVVMLLAAERTEAQPQYTGKRTSAFGDLVYCTNSSYTKCYRPGVYHLCPDNCLYTCYMNCRSCEAVCPSSPPPPKRSPPPPKHSPPHPPKHSPPPPKHSPPHPPKHSPPPPKHSPPPPPKHSPPPPKHSPPPPKRSPPPPTHSPPPPPKHSPPRHKHSPPPHSPPPTSPPPPSPSPPSSPPPISPSLPPPSTSSPPSKAKKVKCKNKYYPTCYHVQQYCPSTCPDSCEVDCVTCSPLCYCNKPGAVCQDPQFIGGDGLTFYFHGKKDKDFCIVTDSNLHINAHFIGRRNENMKRDFTWVQSIGILFDAHRLFVAAEKTVTWDDSVDRLALAFDGEQVLLPDGEGAKWRSASLPRVTITRSRETNAVVIEAEGNFRVKASVVPITQKDSQIHNYGITKEDCFAHLDLSFKFYSLSSEANGVLGQTYGSNYVSRVKMGVAMPVLGGDKEFSSSSLFATDCAVARFNGRFNSTEQFEYADVSCASGMGGIAGVVCKK
ncbi:Root cap [Dillenia turbinata]|uniref:Root cap n=1 Tax=Dillenia turbinata TaxID=194707 RepID=A0AAN8VAQ3_9MAGN